jgi:phosphoribosylanthranilate isomerase
MSVADAWGCVEAGADAIGLNFYERSPRYCEPGRARQIVDAVSERIEVIGVFVDADVPSISALRQVVGFNCTQLHGSEPPGLLQDLLPDAYKALRVRGPEAVAVADRYGGEKILLDAYVPGLAGGTGERFDWIVAKEIAKRRRVIVAGGLTSENVAAAIAAIEPFGVDTASGVESSPGKKDLAQVSAFVRAAKDARSHVS